MEPTRPAGRVDRLYRAVPLATAFLWLVVLYGWQTRGHVTPWLFTDELKLAQISRSIAETGHAAQRGHPSELPDAVRVSCSRRSGRSTTSRTAYAAIKYVGVFVMTSAIFPTYFLARMIVSKPWALFAAVGAVATPALAYAPFLVEEPAAYPWATLCLFLIAKALAARTRWWVARRRRGRLVAPFVRGQLAVLIAVYVARGRSSSLLDERAGKALAADVVDGDWIGAVVLGIGAIILFSAVVGAHSQTWFIATGFYRHRTIVYGLWAAGAFTIGLGAAAGGLRWRRSSGRAASSGRAS